MEPNIAATEHTRGRYNRIAPLYDAMEGVVETLWYRRWRTRLWRDVVGPHVLELGVGTGKNIPFYPPGVQITAIDLSENMLKRARRKLAERPRENVTLQIADAQALTFADASFDTVLATFVFCSVPDPVQGLREALRVTRPGGQLLLLEHMLARPEPLARIMTRLDPPFHWLSGVHIARRTVDNVEAAGWSIDSVTPLSPGSIFRHIVAHRVAPAEGERDARERSDKGLAARNLH